MKRTLKKAVSILLVLALLLPAAAMPAGAEELTWGDFRYEIVTNVETEYAYVKLIGYTGEASELTLPAEIDGLSVVVVESLVGGTCPERLAIPESVRVLKGLFGQKNAALTELVLPQSLKILCGNALSGCTGMTKLLVPQGVSLLVEPTQLPAELTLCGETGSYIARVAEHKKLTFEPIEHGVSMGDLNADGVCNTTDARLALQYAAGIVAPTAEQSTAADVDRSGEADTTDARMILQYTAGVAEIAAITVPAASPTPAFFDVDEVTAATVRLYEQTQYMPQLVAEFSVEDAAALTREVNAMIGQSFVPHAGIQSKAFTTETVSMQTSVGEVTLCNMAGWHLWYYGDVYMLSRMRLTELNNYLWSLLPE